MDTRPSHSDVQHSNNDIDYTEITPKLKDGLWIPVSDSLKMHFYHTEDDVKYYRRIRFGETVFKYILVDLLPVGEKYYVRV